MEPSREEALGMTDVGRVMVWASVEGSPDQPGSDVETLLAHLHFNAGMHPRFVAALTAEQWRRVVQGWLPSGVEPNGQQLASAMLVWTASQAACKHQEPDTAKNDTVALRRNVKFSA
eukprot:6476540-Amphidinium_carterae.1